MSCYLHDDSVRIKGVEVERDGDEVAPQQEDLGGATGRAPHEGLERPAQPKPELKRNVMQRFTNNFLKCLNNL